MVYPEPPVESLPFESLRAVSLSNRQVERQNAADVTQGWMFRLSASLWSINHDRDEWSQTRGYSTGQNHGSALG